MVPARRESFGARPCGLDRRESAQVAFTPFDLSVLFAAAWTCEQAFSLVAEYLRTTDPSAVKNLMDTGIQLDAASAP